jgi:hypothetical protein
MIYTYLIFRPEIDIGIVTYIKNLRRNRLRVKIVLRIMSYDNYALNKLSIFHARQLISLTTLRLRTMSTNPPMLGISSKHYKLLDMNIV